MNDLAAVVIGASQGGLRALEKILTPLPKDFPLPILVARHQSPHPSDHAIQVLQRASRLEIQAAGDNTPIQTGIVYLAPPDRHLLVGQDGRLQLSAGEKVHFSRPSVDPLFSSAADYFGSHLLAVVLTGANSDGVQGVRDVKSRGGRVLVQDPDSAEAVAMPEAAMAAVEVDYVVWLDQIGPFLWQLTRESRPTPIDRP